MLILWNLNAQNILKDFFERADITWNFPFSFILLEWEKHLWKTTLVEKLVSDFLWNYFLTDFLAIRDLSDLIWKKHVLKIDSDEIVEIDWKSYLDLWVRQIQDWLVKSPVWKFKIVYLENIERMNIASANAMLKTFEEPLPNRLIIASTISKSLLLDTIVSRAFIVRFVPLVEKDYENIKNFLSDEDYQIFEKYKNLILSLSQLKPWIVFDFIKKLKKEKDYYINLLEKFERFFNLYERDGNSIVEKFDLLEEFKDSWVLPLFFNFAVYYFDKRLDYVNLKKFLDAKKKIEANLNVDNVLFELCLD